MLSTVVAAPGGTQVRHKLIVRARILIAAITVVVLGIALTEQPAAAYIWTSGAWMQLMSRARECLDVPPATSGQNGGTVQIYPCKNSGAADEANQRWLLTYDSDGLGWRITSVYSNLCLDADTNTPGLHTIVQMWQCNGSDQQLWRLVVNTGATTRVSGPVPDSARHAFSLVNVYHTNITKVRMVLDQTANTGRQVQLYQSLDSPNQAWDGYELQCQYAYQVHYNAITGTCQ